MTRKFLGITYTDGELMVLVLTIVIVSVSWWSVGGHAERRALCEQSGGEYFSGRHYAKHICVKADQVISVEQKERPR